MENDSFLYRHITKILIFLGLLAIVFGAAAIIIYRHYYSGPILLDHEKWGQLGDFFGGLLNPVFSLFAFFALLLTIVLQTKELSLSTQELAKSAQALREQSVSLKKQNFETTFFQMVRLHNDIIADMDTQASNTKKIVKGRDCFNQFYYRFTNHYNEALKKEMYQSQENLIDIAYNSFFKEYQHEIGHYFRNLYTIIKFVHNSDVENKKQYTSIVRAQLSSYELFMLFYNCIWSGGREKFKHLVEEYELLENLELTLLRNPKDQYPLYSNIAYGDLKAPS
jgi:hypothetical protein